MAKKVQKAASKPAPKFDDELARKVAKCRGQGELKRAAELVAASQPSEAQFDKLMADNDGLRETFYRL